MMPYVTSVGVQQFSITIASGSTTGTATINAVGSGAFILWDGLNPSIAANAAEDFAYLTLTNSTTITATRSLGTVGTVLMTGCIIDGDTNNLIKSVQYGTVSIAAAGTSGTVNLGSAVTNANTALHLLGWLTPLAVPTFNTCYPVISLAGKVVTATIPSANASGMTVGFVAIEFQGTALAVNGVQNVSATSSSSVTSYNSGLLTSYSTANSILIYAGSNIATVTTNAAQAKMYATIPNTAQGTNITVNINTASANAKTYNCSVVQFTIGVLNSSVQRGTITISAGTSNTSTITSVNTAFSGITFLGNTTTSTIVGLRAEEGAVTLTNGTTVTETVSSAGTITGSYEVFEFVKFLPGQGGMWWGN